MTDSPLTEVPFAPPAWRQLGVLVNDGSESMTWDLDEPDASLEGMPARTKAAAVDVAVRELLNRMKTGRKATNFSFSFITFNDKVTEERPPQELLSISTTASYDPTANGTGGTAIATGLDAAGRIVEDFMRGDDGLDVPSSAVVVVLSDGEDGDQGRTMAVAQRLRELPNTVVAACLFATKGGSSSGARLLQGIVSEPRLYQTVYSAEQLREFFHASITTTVLALPPGQDDRY